MGNQLADLEDEKIIQVKEEGTSLPASEGEWEACFKAKVEGLREELVERIKDLSKQPGVSSKEAARLAQEEIETEARCRTDREMQLRELGFCRLFLLNDPSKGKISLGYADLIEHHLSGRRWLERAYTLAEFTADELKDAARSGMIVVEDVGGRVRKFTNFNPGLLLGQLSRLGK